jgi:hypothetical protein
MSFFLEKRFDAVGIGVAEYWRCKRCGFVVSKTHHDMDAAAWGKLNHDCHASYQGSESDPGDPRWQTRLRSQALIIHDAQQIELLNPRERWLDYACGDGKLSDLLHLQYHLDLLKYERYVRQGQGYLDEKDLVPGGFGFVITTSVFEHLRFKKEFDHVNSLVAKEGVLGLHTLVSEAVPQDPNWFYLAPVHSSFHTNRSMQILFEQWGYTSSVYSVEAQLWLWFKTDRRRVEEIVRGANLRSEGPFYVFKPGFVDYWKCVPVRQPQGKAS